MHRSASTQPRTDRTQFGVAPEEMPLYFLATISSSQKHLRLSRQGSCVSVLFRRIQSSRIRSHFGSRVSSDASSANGMTASLRRAPHAGRGDRELSDGVLLGQGTGSESLHHLASMALTGYGGRHPERLYSYGERQIRRGTRGSWSTRAWTSRGCGTG